MWNDHILPKIWYFILQLHGKWYLDWYLGRTPIYQEVTFDLLLTKICLVVNRDLANYLWKREFLVAELSQYSLQHILNDFLSHSSSFEHIELFRCVLHWLNDFLSSSGNPGNYCSTISNYGIFDMFNHDPVFAIFPDYVIKSLHLTVLWDWLFPQKHTILNHWKSW